MMIEPQWRFTEQENRLKTIKITIMKKLFTFFAIILSIGIANAQTKKPVATTNTDATTVTKEPSLEETVEYINKIWRALPKLIISETWNFNPENSESFGNSDNKWSTSNTGELSCKEGYARYYVNYEYQPENFVEVVEVSDWNLKTNGIEVGAVALVSKAKTIRVIEEGFNVSDTCQLSNTDRLFFYYNKSNPGEKERLIKALNHYIKLSKTNAKADPFAN